MNLKDYQQKAVNTVIDHYESNEHLSYVHMAEGTGKGFVLINTCIQLLRNNNSLKILLLCKNKGLQRRYINEINDLFPKILHQIEITTYQTLINQFLGVFPFDIILGDSLAISQINRLHSGFKKTTNIYICNFVSFIKLPNTVPLIFKYTLKDAIEDINLLPFKVVKQTEEFQSDGINKSLEYLLSKTELQNDSKVILICNHITQASMVYDVLQQLIMPHRVVLLTSNQNKFNRLTKEFIDNDDIKYAVGVNVFFTGFDLPKLTDVALFRELNQRNLTMAVSKVLRPYKEKKYGTIWDFSRNNFNSFLMDYAYEEVSYRDKKAEEIKSLSWVDEFHDLSRSLINLYLDDEDYAGYRLYELCSKSNSFLRYNSWFKKYSKFENVRLQDRASISPLQIYASITEPSLNSFEKTRRLHIYLDLFNFDYDPNNESDYIVFHEIDFNGCISLPTELLTAHQSRDEQQTIWEVFHGASHSITINKNIIAKTKSWNVNDLRSLSTFLFLLSPNYFLPLDKQIIAFLMQNKKISSEPRTVGEYNQLLAKQETSAYRTIALLAHEKLDESMLSVFFKGDYDKYVGDVGSTLISPHKCRILALKPKRLCNHLYLKSLKSEEVFKLYQFIDIEDEHIKYQENFNHNLFSLESLDISLSSVVGKNGTGKSTLIELLILAFNNISYQRNAEKRNLSIEYVEDIYLDIWFETDALYKVSLNGEDISFIKYKTEGDHFYYPEGDEYDITSFEDESFFYTISINYSIHALNSNHNAGWLKQVFHKNDSYQTPIVLEPLRTEGNVDINQQEELAKHRLMTNLLQFEVTDKDAFSLRTIKEGVKAKYLKLNLNEDKYLSVPSELHSFLVSNENNKLLIELLAQFEVDDIKELNFKGKELGPYGHCCFYILRKLFYLTQNYKVYNRFLHFNSEPIERFSSSRFINIKQFCKQLSKDHSHATYKLRQAINFIKHGLYPKTTWNHVDIEKVSNHIQEIIVNDRYEKVEYLLPPAFLSKDIYTENGVEFSALSSGEKQKIYVLNSIAYHLRNLDSISTSSNHNLCSYNYVNIFLDEIELCFHPELQRTLIFDLRNTLNKLSLKYIYGVNFCFITHSPFLLSDIPTSNILLLKTDHETKSTTSERNNLGTQNTFAANIHDLLSDGFFMNSTIGAFAESKIKEIVTLHQKIIDTNNEGLEKIANDFKSNYEVFKYVKDSISDPYIRGVIINHLQDIEHKLGLLEPLVSIDDEIRKLEDELFRLREMKEK